MRNCESRRPSLLATFVRRTLAMPIAFVRRTLVKNSPSQSYLPSCSSFCFSLKALSFASVSGNLFFASWNFSEVGIGVEITSAGIGVLFCIDVFSISLIYWFISSEWILLNTFYWLETFQFHSQFRRAPGTYQQWNLSDEKWKCCKVLIYSEYYLEKKL